MIRCLLFQASHPASYWAEALNTATHLLKRLPLKAVSHPTPTSPCMAQPPPTTTFACSAVPAIPTLPSPLPISYLLAPPAASSSVTPLTTRGIAVLTSLPTAYSSLVTSFSTKMCFPLLAPPHSSISTLSLSPISFPLHLGHSRLLTTCSQTPRLAPLPAPRAASTPPLASLPVPRAATSTPPAPRAAPSMSVTRFANPALIYHHRGRATPLPSSNQHR
jgi:hypothetical protein